MQVNTKLLMITSAIVLGVLGILFSFLPEEITHYIVIQTSASILLQILGALYFGFAMLNWMAKANLIGGIYSRPVAIANFTHFFIGALALIKFGINNSSPTYIWIAATIYAVFALLFGFVFFINPIVKKSV